MAYDAKTFKASHWIEKRRHVLLHHQILSCCGESLSCLTRWGLNGPLSGTMFYSTSPAGTDLSYLRYDDNLADVFCQCVTLIHVYEHVFIP